MNLFLLSKPFLILCISVNPLAFISLSVLVSSGCLKSSMTLEVVLTFDAFCIPQYPWDMCKGFIWSLALLWVGNPLALALAGLAVFHKFLVVLILNGTWFMSPGSDQMGMEMETDVAPVMGISAIRFGEIWGFFEGTFSPGGEVLNYSLSLFPV